jgi:parvulin-like peptidyl-prolyl isomerase
MKTFCVMLAVGALWASTWLLPAEEQTVNGIDAVVHDAVVTLSEVQVLTLPAMEMLYRQYRDQSLIFQKKLADARNDSLEQLIERQLILHDFKTTFSRAEQQAAVEKLINKDIDQEIEAEIKARYGGSRMTMIQTLQAEGITMERHRQQIRDRLIVTWLRQKNISQEVIVSPHRVEEYYLAHREGYKLPEEVKLRMIVLKCPAETEAAKTEKLAEDILAEINAGATFVEMATIHSEGSQRSQGGDMGWLAFPAKPGEATAAKSDQDTLEVAKYLGDTAAALQAGQHSGVLSRSAGDDFWVCQYDKGQITVGRHYVVDATLKKETMVQECKYDSAAAAATLPPPTEFYLLLVEGKRAARFKTITEMRSQIEKSMVAEERTRLEKQWVNKLKQKTFVRVF